MRKLISILLILALALSLAPLTLAEGREIHVSTHKLTLNGEPVRCQAYYVAGHNYFRLRDLAMLFQDTDSRFSVDWDGAKRTVSITTGAAYTPVGDELDEMPRDLSKQGVESSQTILINGKQVDDLSVWSFGGSNYFKLAELGPKLNFKVSYDADSGTVMLESATLLLPRPDVKPAKSYGEVLDSLRAAGYGYGYAEEDAAEAEMPAAEPAAVNTTTTAAAETRAEGAKGTGNGDDEASGTNVQVQGVDEGDIVKSDGSYFYVLNGDMELSIVRADGPDSELVSRIQVGESDYESSEDKENYSYYSLSKYPQELYVSGDRLAVVSSYSMYMNYRDDAGWHWDSEDASCVDVYDVSDRSEPVLLASLGQDGYMNASRMTDGKLYLVTDYWVYSYDEEVPESYVPVLYRDDTRKAMAAEDILVCEETNGEFVVVGVYDLEEAALSDSLSLLGSGDEVYMTADSLYVMGTTWESEQSEPYQESVYEVTEYRNGSNTEIFRFDLTDGLVFAAAGKLPGYLDDQFSADEYDGRLRVVTTRSESVYRLYYDPSYDFYNYQWEDSEQSSGLYVLDLELNVVGSVTDLAPGERIYSARFDGEIAYFTTFRNVDPLFTVDLSDPTHPEVLSALKISGFSEYLHNWGAGRLFGFGREADEETGWAQELKLVMFDTEDKTDVGVAHTLALDLSYSEALYNHKAFLIDVSKNLIGFFAGCEYFIFSYDEQTGFTELCRVEMEDEWEVRGFYIGHWLYVVGSESIAVVDMENWEVAGYVEIS